MRGFVISPIEYTIALNTVLTDFPKSGSLNVKIGFIFFGDTKF